ncbi:PQQ-binding-like beta-propeller repeat protein [Rubripirellula sp.]|nr:PQQ-binding-like beta-propeller repeat protein [Rubripirellula sp.]
MHQRTAKVLTFLTSVFVPTILLADWPNWRGVDGSGTIAYGDFPASLDSTHLDWKFSLPGKGCSTPAIFSETIYVTAPEFGRDALMAVDKNGKKIWSVSFGEEKPGKHRNGSGSNPSPTVDTSGIYVYYKSGTLAAVNTDGKIRWQTNLVDRFGNDTLFWDHGSSPVLTDNHVIMTRMHNGESWIAAFDKVDGSISWKTSRNYETPTECDHGYTTPLVMTFKNQESILTWGAEHLTIHDAQNGQLVWTCGDFNPTRNKLWPAIATPVIVDSTAVICFGRNDRDLPQMHGIRIEGEGDVSKTQHRWMREDVSSFVPSPISYKKYVYLVRDRGEVECIEPRTGRTIWSDALPKSRSDFYATPLIANGMLYAAREDGMVFVARLNDQGIEILSANEMEQSVISSPVPMNGKILIRGEKDLFCFSDR